MNVLYPVHASLLVSDLAASRQFYGEVLGLPEIERSPTLTFAGCWYQLGALQLHLIVDPSAPNGIHNRAKWGRNNHLALAIANVEQAKAQFAELKIAFQSSSSGRPAIFVADPDGHVIELLQAVS